MTNRTTRIRKSHALERASVDIDTRTLNVQPSTRADGNETPAKLPSKTAQIAALMLQDEGATLAQMIAATGWLPHTTRAALTGLRKKGYAISSDKLDGIRTYRAISPEAA